MKSHVFFLNERNVVSFLVRGLRRRPTFVAEVTPYFLGSRWPLQKIVGLAYRLGWAQPVSNLDQGRPWLDERGGRGPHNDIYIRIEEAAETALGIAARLGEDDEYSYPARKAASFYILARANEFLIVEWLEKEFRDRVELVDAKPDLIDYYRLYHGRAPNLPFSLARRSAIAGNFLTWGLVCLFALAWLAIRVRPGGVPLRRFHLAYDCIAPTDVMLVGCFTDRPSDTAIYFRNPALQKEYATLFPGLALCRKEQARVSVSDGLALAGQAIRDGWRLFRTFADRDPDLFQSLAVLAAKRAMYAAFFRRFRIAFFWGRDDYAIDHVIRTQELRKHGGKALGINHGLPIVGVDPAWRYIDYDIYYTFGRHLHEHYYRGTWSPRMAVKPVGTMHMTRDHLARLSDPRPKDVGCFMNPRHENPYILEQIFKVARHFPDRIFWVKIKGSRRHDGSCLDVLDALKQAPANVRETLEDTYELFLRISYALTAGSTVTAEAIQYRVAAFTFDLAKDEPYYYRDFPGLCLETADDIIRRIEAIESGAAPYPREAFSGLIDLSEQWMVDRVRKDMDMPPLAGTTR